MKRISLRGYLIMAFVVMAVAVTALYVFNMKRITPTTQKSDHVQVVAGVSDDDYRTVIKDGHYVTSAARGITASSETNKLDTKQFETGLLAVAKKTFSPDKYVFQEGQYLSADTVTDWLARSSDNKSGLNPADNGKKDDKREPTYIQSLTEQDFMTKDGDKLALSGIVVGVAMNTKDDYQKEKYGATFTQTISQDAMAAYGKKIAPELVKRIRQQRGVPDNVPIVIAMYANAPTDSLAAGNFYATATSDRGNQLGDWHAINDKTLVLPKEATDTSKLGADDNNAFANFKNEIQNFFPNVAGATANATYTDGHLTKMTIKVTTQFYSQTEIDSFSAFVSQQATRYLPDKVPIQITIEAAGQMQTCLTRKNNEKVFTTVRLDD